MLCEYTSDGRSLNLVFRWVADADAHEVNQAALALTPTPNRTSAEISTFQHPHICTNVHSFCIATRIRVSALGSAASSHRSRPLQLRRSPSPGMGGGPVGSP